MSHTQNDSGNTTAKNDEIGVASTHDAIGPSTDLVGTTRGSARPETSEKLTIDLWRNCQAYGDDWRIAQMQGMKRAPRIPNNILDSIRRLDIDFSRAISTLGVTANHLRNALANRGSAATGERTASVSRRASPGSVSEESVEPHVGGEAKSLRSVRGEDAEVRVHLAVLDHYERHGAVRRARFSVPSTRSPMPLRRNIGLLSRTSGLSSRSPALLLPRAQSPFGKLK